MLYSPNKICKKEKNIANFEKCAFEYENSANQKLLALYEKTVVYYKEKYHDYMSDHDRKSFTKNGVTGYDYLLKSQKEWERQRDWECGNPMWNKDGKSSENKADVAICKGKKSIIRFKEMEKIFYDVLNVNW